MTREPHPAFLFYASDFLTSTVEMEAAQVGMYIRLLAHEWINGPFTTNFKTVCRLAGIESTDADACAMLQALLEHRFSIDLASKYSNRRLESVRAETHEKSIQNKARARKAAEKRWDQSRAPGADATSIAPSNALSNATNDAKTMLTEDEDENRDIQYTDTGIVEGNIQVMSSDIQLSAENEKFPFDTEKRYNQFQEMYGKPGKRQTALRAYVAAIQHLGRAPTHYPPITAAKILEDAAVDSRLYDVRTKKETRLNPETWLEEQSYLTDWKSALDTYLNDRNTQEQHGNPKKRGNNLLEAASEYTRQLPPI